MKFRCLLIDDEPLALEIIESYIGKVQGLEIVAKCSNAIDALEVLRYQSVDIIFLDVEMPQLSGIEFLNILENAPKVIFTTAHPKYALQGYDFDVIDYLLKPISFSRFLKAVNKLHRITNAADKEPIMTSATTHPVEKQLKFIYVKEDKRMVKIYLDDILFIESLKDYVRIHTHSRSITTKQQISYLEQKLPSTQFLRVHRSYLIAMNKIQSFASNCVEIKSQEIPIGRSYKHAVMAKLTDRGVRV